MAKNEKEKLERAQERFIDTISKNMNLYGVTPSVGRLYGTMYFADEPMTLDEMKEELQMSKTSMSMAVRNLMDLNMVDKTWQKGVRKDLYVVEEDWYQTFTDFFCIKWRKGVNMNVEALQWSLKDLKELAEDPEVSSETKNLIEKDKEKLQNALEYYDWLNRLVDSFETGEIFEFIPKGKSTATK